MRWANERNLTHRSSRGHSTDHPAEIASEAAHGREEGRVILALLIGLPMFAWWAYARAETARRRDLAAQVDRAILMTLLLNVSAQRDEALAGWKNANAALLEGAEHIKARNAQDLSRRLRELHIVSLN